MSVDKIINVELIRNPANWAVIFSMVLIGAIGFHVVSRGGE